MGVETIRSTAARRFIEGLSLPERAAVEASEATIQHLVLIGVDLNAREMPVEGSRRLLIARVERVHSAHHRIYIEYLGEPESRWEFGRKPDRMTREEAIQIVEDGIGKRPDLPPGSEYVERVRGVWRGLMPNGRRDS